MSRMPECPDHGPYSGMACPQCASDHRFAAAKPDVIDQPQARAPLPPWLVYARPIQTATNYTARPPKGCICPPGSEETCRRRDCGRKDAQ